MLNVLERKIPPVATMLACAVAMRWVAHRTPAWTWPIPGRLLVAVLLAAVGGGFALAGLWAFRKARTTIHPHRLDRTSAFVAHGVYRVTRNPMYLGLLLVLLAWAVRLSNLPAVAFLPAFVLYMDRFQILPEERVLREKFGDAYADYAKSVRRWI